MKAQLRRTASHATVPHQCEAHDATNSPKAHSGHRSNAATRRKLRSCRHRSDFSPGTDMRASAPAASRPHAGVSRGAQEHYFPKKNDLIAAATRHAMREAVEQPDRSPAPLYRLADPVAKFLTDSEHFFFRPVFRAMAEIMIAARSDRALARRVEPYRSGGAGRAQRHLDRTLDAAGYPRENAQRFIELTHYLLRGLSSSRTGCPTGSTARRSSRSGGARTNDPQTDGFARPPPPAGAASEQISETQREVILQGVLLVKTWSDPCKLLLPADCA